MEWFNKINARIAGEKARTTRIAVQERSRNTALSIVGNGRAEFGAANFQSYVRGVYQANGILFACIAARCRIFSQARFAYQHVVDGRPLELVPSAQLSLLDSPWAHGTTGELLTHMDVDVAMSGNFYATVADELGNVGPSNVSRSANPFISRLRPDWVQLVIDAPSGNPNGLDARVVGLVYRAPGGPPVLLPAGEFAHYSPIPDPLRRFVGMSWLTPILRDVALDNSINTYKKKFLDNGATPQLSVVLPEETDPDEFDAFVEKFRQEYEGPDRANRTLLISGGADVTPLSLDLSGLDLRGVQGALETRIAAAAGVHPTIVGLSEGLQGSSLNAGNYNAARRIATDMTVRGLWGMAAASLAPLVPKRADHRLWYDDRDIPFLREDAKDEADIFNTLSTALRTLVDGGWDPDASVKAAKARDIGLLVGGHTGRLSVQLQPAGAGDPSDDLAQMPTFGT